ADIYTWTDAKGTVNVSNVAPPEGTRITKVVQESPPEVIEARAAAAAAAREAEVQLLAARVRQLEYEAEMARRQPPMVMYAPAPTPPSVIQYVMNVAPPQQSQYPYGCDGSWGDCGSSWGSGFYPPNVFVVGTPAFRARPPFQRGHRGMQGQSAVRAPRGMH
ncbi:MAG: DUF4124 domain-containing protein, partial [Betaproteobacteria bacterium]